MTMEPWWTLRTGAVPFWMTFNEDTSVDALEQYLREAEPFDIIHLRLFQNGTEGPRLATIARWKELLGKARQVGGLPGRGSGQAPEGLRRARELPHGHAEDLGALPDARAAGAEPAGALPGGVGDKYPVVGGRGAPAEPRHALPG
ncbi:MAG TPA: hypothetical protein VEU33_36395 [Archangium sp.]|nr:hypothetical protein [Archangium sp.]